MITLYNMEVRKALSQMKSDSISCVVTSPPYWALRDYGSEVETIWDEKEGCEHEWIKGQVAGDSRIEKRSENRAGWERPSREEFASRDIKNVCPVCKKEFEGKPNQKFCSLECLNTLSNEERTNTKQTSNFCSLCNAWKGQLGLEPTFDLYIKHLCDIFDEVKRVLRKDGTCWINLGDTYGTKSGSGFANDNLNPLTPDEIAEGTGIYKANELRGTAPKMHKNLCNIPARFSIEMQNRGWILRNILIWHKPNCMPSSVKDRFTVDFEYIFFFVKNKKYWFETQYDEIAESSKKDNRLDKGREEHIGKSAEKQFGCNATVINSYGRNKRAVWRITTQPYREAHFATFPESLVETPIKAGCPEFICSKCGKAREPIFEPTEEYKIKLDNIKGLPSGNFEEGYAYYKSKTDSCVANYIKKGALPINNPYLCAI